MPLEPDILAYTQCEKVKAGLIWLSQGMLPFKDQLPARPAAAEQLVLSILAMIRDEVHLGWRLTGEAGWRQADGHLQQAVTMIRSGVAHDAPWHLTLALRQITALGQAAHRRLSGETPRSTGRASS